MSLLIDNSIDVLSWFLLKSNTDGISASGKKMHALLYLSLGYYAVASDGEKLFPSVFVAKSNGIYEPNLLKACKYFSSPPTISSMDKQAVMFLESIWRKYGESDEKVLINMLRNSTPYQNAIKNGENSEILFSDMYQHFKTTAKIPKVQVYKQDNLAKDSQSVIMKNEKGKIVKTKSWQPKRIS